MGHCGCRHCIKAHTGIFCRNRWNSSAIKPDMPLDEIFFQQQRGAHFLDMDLEPIGVYCRCSAASRLVILSQWSWPLVGCPQQQETYTRGSALSRQKWVVHSFFLCLLITAFGWL